MKSKVRILTLVGFLAGGLAGLAQDNTPPPATLPETGSPAAPAAPAKDSAPAGETPAATPAPAPAGDAAPAAPAGTPAPAPAGDAAPAPAPQPAAEAPTASTTVAPAAAPANVAANDTPAPTNAAPAGATAGGAAQPGEVIPLIVMDDVPLTDAIRNLARQAGLNYMLDPKIGFGQPGPGGQVTPQPSVSIRWEKITAEQALNALLNNHSLQLVEDPKTKIYRVTVKDPAAPPDLVTKVIQLKYAAPSNIVAAVQNAFIDKRSKVVADVRTSQLVVLATEKEQIEAEALVTKLDTITRQVLIEAKLLETSVNPSTAKGVDWTRTLDAQSVKIGNNAPGGVVGVPAVIASLSSGSFFSPASAFLNADGVSVVLSFLNKYADSKVISSPRTVTLDNEMAHIAVTRASPIINVTAGTANTTGGSTITYTNLGIILNVTPRISANNYVNLKVTPEVSRVADTITRKVNDATFIVDEYDSRQIDTKVMIPSGNTLLLGGLVQDDVRKGSIKVPVLGDIPGLSALFRSDTKSRQKSELLVFITPTIVTDDDYQPTKSTFLKTPVPTSDVLEGDWSAWDSGKRKDWKHGGTKD